MEVYVLAIVYFFYMIGWGSFFFLPIVDSELTGAGFRKLIISISVSALLGAWIVLQSFLNFKQQHWLNSFFALNFALHVFLYFKHRDRSGGFEKITYSLISIFYFLNTIIICHSLSSWLFLMTGILLMGITNYAMLLGHYYLVVPKLSEKQLIKALNFFIFIFVLKFLFSTCYLLQNLDILNWETTRGDGYLYNWIFISMRFLWGFVANIVLFYFAYRLTKMRSIQSATGVLYIMVFFALIGEFLSVLMFTRDAWLI